MQAIQKETQSLSRTFIMIYFRKEIVLLKQLFLPKNDHGQKNYEIIQKESIYIYIGCDIDLFITHIRIFFYQ